MVIVAKAYGNHSNRLFQNLHLEAFCIDNDIPFFNASFYSMASLYSFSYNYVAGVLLIFLLKMVRLLRLSVYKEFADPNKIDSYRQVLLKGRSSIVFVGGGEFRDHNAVKNHSPFLKQKYTSPRTNDGFSAISELMNRYDIVLGVHIRRGDYQQWLGGKYYFDDSSYLNAVRSFIDLHKGKKIFVVFFSNGDIESLHDKCPVDSIVSHNPYFIDYRLMGNCHFLIGPVSTFTLWASFLYGVPYVHLSHRDQVIRMDDFKVCEG